MKTYLSIILPAHNEEKRIETALYKSSAFLIVQPYAAEILVVANGCTDATVEAAETWIDRNATWLNAHSIRARVLVLDQAGKGRAVKTGMLAAQGKYRLFADTDFSMPAPDLERLLPPEIDSSVGVAIASRETCGAMRLDEPPLRHITSHVYNWLVRALALPGIHDSQCGFKCFRADAAETIFRHMTTTGWGFDVEALLLARRFDYAIQEVPVCWRYDANSKLRLVGATISMFRDLLKLRRMYVGG